MPARSASSAGVAGPPSASAPYRPRRSPTYTVSTSTAAMPDSNIRSARAPTCSSTDGDGVVWVMVMPVWRQERAGIARSTLAPNVAMRWNAVVQAHDGFVGRSEPVAELVAMRRAAAAGHGGVVVVGGEAGIGKTSL